MIILSVINTVLLGLTLILLLLAAGMQLSTGNKKGLSIYGFLCAVITINIVITWLLYSMI